MFSPIGLSKAGRELYNFTGLSKENNANSINEKKSHGFGLLPKLSNLKHFDQAFRKSKDLIGELIITIL